MPKRLYYIKINNKTMRHSLAYIVVGSAMVLSVLLLSGCQKDKLYINDTDLSAELDLGLAFPVGTMRATIGDFLGGSVQNLYVDSVENNGVFTYKGSYERMLRYHDVDLGQYISSTDMTMKVYNRLKDESFVHDHRVVGTGTPFVLTYPMTLKLSGINKDVSFERLDSALIKNARFVSTIQKNPDLPLQWEWIDKVTIDLGSAFHRPQGNEITVYDKRRNGDNRYNYGSEIPISVDEFSLCLMKNKQPHRWTEYENNVLDSCDFHINFHITIPTTAGELYVSDDAAFDYTLQVQFIDYYAIWGMFQPSGDMHDEDVVDMAKEWDMWHKFRQATLPFAQPRADVHITTRVAGALMVYGDYLYVKEASGKRQDVELGDEYNPYYFKKGQYLSLDSEIGDSVTMTLTFDKNHGNLQQAFAVRPDYVGYKYHIDFNQQETPQVRITPNTGVHFRVDYRLPFIFKENMGVQYADTIRDVDLSRFTLDSLLGSVPYLDSLKSGDLKLIIKLQNTIQLGMTGVFRALDADGNAVIDPTTGEPFQLTGSDTITIAPPTFAYQNGTWVVTQPHEQTEIISVTPDKFDALAQIKSIAFDATIDNKALNYAFEQGNFNTRLTDDANLKIGIGIAAQVEAVFDFGTIDNIANKNRQ